MMAAARFVWRASRGHRFRPWRSDYLRWRVETYSGMAAESITAGAFWKFCWRERWELGRFLRWTSEMSGHRRHSRHPVQSAEAGPQETA